jgi:hypothetical protein
MLNVINSYASCHIRCKFSVEFWLDQSITGLKEKKKWTIQEKGDLLKA